MLSEGGNYWRHILPAKSITARGSRESPCRFVVETCRIAQIQGFKVWDNRLAWKKSLVPL